MKCIKNTYLRKEPQGGVIMKVNTINTIYTPISFKDNPTSEPIKPVQAVPANIPTDTLQFKQSMKVKKSLINKIADFIAEFAKKPSVDLTQYRPGMTPEEVASTRISLY